MVSLSYRSLANYILEDNLIGFRGFLENRHVAVDDRDDVKNSFQIVLELLLLPCHS